MPDSLTKNDKIYLDAYQLAMADGFVTEKERNMLLFQAKTLGINADRIKYLEFYFDDQKR